MITGMITARIDNRLWVLKADLPVGHEDAIKQRLTIPNGEKAAAKKRRQWGWEDLPDFFPLYEDDGSFLVLPRGYAAELRAGIEMSGNKITWSDHTSAPSLPLLEMVARGPTLRPEQEKACQAILQHRQGVLMSPTGSGKTCLALEAWRRTGLRGLILVEKVGLAKQWRERAREHLGIEVGMIGEGEWEEKHLTIALMQTLRARDVGEDFWKQWGFTACDEVHHCRNNSYSDVVKNVCSRYLVGVTATPLEGMWEQPFLTHGIGPIFHITTPETLRKSGLRVTPEIRRVHTSWRWVRQNAREEALVDTKVIYRYVLRALVEDKSRAYKIARTICDQPDDCAQLVVAKRLAYLDLIEDRLYSCGYPGDVYMMRGSESGDRRADISLAAAAGHCVILSTVADEGLDIPRLDRLHLTFPGRQELALTQQIGRVLRKHPDKRSAIVFDYVDSEGMLEAQARLRAGVYRKAGYSIKEARDMQGIPS